MYTVEERETLMSIRGNLSVRPSTASGAAFFSIQILRDLNGVLVEDPQDDSGNYRRFIRLWDYVVSFDAGANETRLILIVSKKRRKLYAGDQIHIVRNSNVASVAVFSLDVVMQLLKA